MYSKATDLSVTFEECADSNIDCPCGMSLLSIREEEWTTCPNCEKEYMYTVTVWERNQHGILRAGCFSGKKTGKEKPE